MDKFITHEITIAGYLMGVKDIKLLSATRNDNNQIRIVLDIPPKDATVLLYDLPTSETMKFDRCVQFLKKLIFKK